MDKHVINLALVLLHRSRLLIIGQRWGPSWRPRSTRPPISTSRLENTERPSLASGTIDVQHLPKVVDIIWNSSSCCAEINDWCISMLTINNVLSKTGRCCSRKRRSLRKKSGEAFVVNWQRHCFTVVAKENTLNRVRNEPRHVLSIIYWNNNLQTVFSYLD